MWPFKQKPSTCSCFPIGEYCFDMQIETIKGLKELSSNEYAVMNKTFKGEQIFHAPPVMFLGRSWKIMLGTVYGRAYKIAAYLELHDKNEANRAALGTLYYCKQQLGKPTEQKTGFFFWKTVDGNVLLQTAETTEGFGINLFVTSSTVNNFEYV